MSFYDQSFEIQGQIDSHSSKFKNEYSQTKVQKLSMKNTKQKIINNPYFRQILLKSSPQIANQLQTKHKNQISTHQIQGYYNQPNNFKCEVYQNEHSIKVSQKEVKSKSILSFQQYSSDYVQKMQKVQDKDKQLNECFNSRSSLKIFAIRSQPFQNPRIDEQFEI